MYAIVIKIDTPTKTSVPLLKFVIVLLWANRLCWRRHMDMGRREHLPSASLLWRPAQVAREIASPGRLFSSTTRYIVICVPDGQACCVISGWVVAFGIVGQPIICIDTTSFLFVVLVNNMLLANTIHTRSKIRYDANAALRVVQPYIHVFAWHVAHCVYVHHC